jgi:peptide/nickel transport system permease protein
MLTLVGRRLLVAIPMLFVVATLAFLLISLIPGDPAVSILGPDATAAQIAALRHSLGLDQPLLAQYGHWLLGALSGNLGESTQTGQPVVQLIAERLPVTISITLLGVAVTFVIGIALGLLSSLGGPWAGRITQVVSVLGLSIPSFWLGVLLVLLFSVTLNLLPATGYVPFGQSPSGWATSLVLPVFTVALAAIASVARQTRAAVNETLSKDYVRTLLATGTPRGTIVMKHALRNASIPVVSSLGFQFITIFGGAFIIEQVFALQGLGQLTVSAVTNHDIPLIQGVVLVSAILVIVVNLVVDVLYAWLNPRVRRS